MEIKPGERFRKNFTISEEIYRGFIALFQDQNPRHTDEAFAREKGFRGRVMHGNILGGFLSYFIGECLPVKNVIIHKQEIKYLKPAYLDDFIAFEAIVNDIHESVNAIEFKFIFKNEAGKKLAKGSIQIGII